MTSTQQRLPRNSVYASVRGRAEFDALYDRILTRLPYPATTQVIPTSFGRTHITTAGNGAGKPLVLLPGMSIIGPRMIEFFAQHGEQRLLIAPDLIGQPGRSEDAIHESRNHGFARWLIELLDALGIDKADMAGGSFGSSVGLDLAAFAPERAGRQVLIAPAGLTPRIPVAALFYRLAFPWMMHRLRPNMATLPHHTRWLAAQLSADDLEYLDLIARHTAFYRHRPAGPFFPADFANYREPVFLVTSGRDYIFPRAPTRANAVAALNVTEEIYLPESAHVVGDADMVVVNQRIAAFLAS